MSFSFADFKARFPELSSVDEGFFNVAKSSAALSVNQDIWLARFDEGVKLMTAHIISLSSRNGVSGSVIESEVDDLRRRFSDMAKDLGPLGATSYGAEFSRMMNCTVPTPIFFC